MSVLELIDSLKNTKTIDPRRIYIIGHSMGASSTISAVRSRPNLFAGAVAVSGIPDLANVNQLRQTPLWLIHGNKDPENDISSDIFLTAKKAKRVRFGEIDQFEHEIYPALFSGDALPNGCLSKLKSK